MRFAPLVGTKRSQARRNFEVLAAIYFHPEEELCNT